MKKTLACVFLIVTNVVEVNAHNTFLKFKSHYLTPQTEAFVSLMNGTFEKSENSIALRRMQDVRIVGPKQQGEQPNSSQWRLTKNLNLLHFKTGEQGTYVVGVSIKPRMIEMSAKDYNKYLKHDGVLDILEARRKSGELDQKVKEKYSKHVKALFQVGEKRTEDFGQVFDYPIEIIPQQNPLALGIGDILTVKVVFNGKLVKNQLIYASYEGFHKHDEDGGHAEAVHTRTNKNGSAHIKLGHKGRWYVRLIHMVPSKEKGVDYESNWATLTFEIK